MLTKHDGSVQISTGDLAPDTLIANIMGERLLEGDCDKCGSKTIQRADETVEAISKRLDTYDEMTAPLADYYDKKGSLFTVVATSSDKVVEEVTARL